jgi:hypothetical protein
MSLVALFLVGCGGSNTTTGGGGGMMPDMAPSNPTGLTGMPGQHGQLLDYFTSAPLAGFTIKDGDNMTTSDAMGYWSLPSPQGVVLDTSVSGPDYTVLHLPQTVVDPTGTEVNRGVIPIPAAMSLALEVQITSADDTKGMVQITVLKRGNCTSVAGGTVTVTKPEGVGVAYFTTQGLPTNNVMVDRDANRPAAVVYNIPPGEDIELQFNHPTCKMVAEGTIVNGGTLTGKVTIEALQPGSVNSDLVYMLE